MNFAIVPESSFTVSEYNSIHGGRSPKPATYKSLVLARAVCIPLAKTISVTLFTAVHLPIKVPSDLYTSLFKMLAAVAFVPLTVKVTEEFEIDSLSFAFIPVSVIPVLYPFETKLYHLSLATQSSERL